MSAEIDRSGNGDLQGDTLEVVITALGAQGDGVADIPQGPVYVPFALPGERVRVRRTSADRARSIELIDAASERVVPVCRHFESCGGCVAQHMARTLYRDWKLGFIARAFAHRGLAPVIADMIEVAPGTRRRAVMAARQTGQAGDAATVVLGFHAPASDRIVHLGACPVLVPRIVKALPALRSLAAVMLGNGCELTMTVTAVEQGLDVAITGDGLCEGPSERSALGRIASPHGIVRLTCNRDLIVQTMAPMLRLGGAEVELPPGAFIQATTEAETAIAAVIVGAVGRAKRVADLFAGVGTFTFPLARKARVLAIDSEPGAIAALSAAARRLTGAKPIETRVRDLLSEPLSRKELEDIDAVVFDPPRAGAKAQAEMLAKSRVPVVAAVSCNPATLARDVRILVDAGYRLEAVTPIDQFLWSAHVEAVAVLRRG